MEVQEILAQSMRREAERIRFLERARGRAEARLFARRTCSGYRRAVLGRTAPAGETVYRLRLLGAYCYLKRYLASTQRHQPPQRAPDNDPAAGRPE